MPVGDENRVVVGQGPKAIVEQPVGVFGEGDTVVQVVVAAAGELMDVAGIDDSAGVEGDEAVAGQGACVVVGCHHADPEAPFPPPLGRFLVCGQGINSVSKRRGVAAGQGTEGHLFARLEIGANKDGPGLHAQSGIVDCRQKLRGKTQGGRQFAMSEDIALCVERCPETVGLHMIERHLDVRPLRPAVGDDGPVAGEAEGKFAGHGQKLLGESALFGNFQQTEKQQGFVRGRAFGAVDVEVGEFGEERWHLIDRRTLVHE